MENLDGLSNHYYEITGAFISVCQPSQINPSWNFFLILILRGFNFPKFELFLSFFIQCCKCGVKSTSWADMRKKESVSVYDGKICLLLPRQSFCLIIAFLFEIHDQRKQYLVKNIVPFFYESAIIFIKKRHMIFDKFLRQVTW